MPATRYQPNPDYSELLDQLLETKRELRNVTIAELMPDHSRELVELLRQRVREKRKAIVAVLRPEIRLRADAMKNGRRYSVLERRRRRRVRE
jgi:riboflavin synthase